MHFIVGVTASGFMIVLPLLLQFDVSKPPTGLTGWLVFVLSLSGVLGLLQLGIQRFVVGPMMMKALQDIPTRIEFQKHVSDDKEFQDRFEGLIERWQHGVPERRQHAQRRGDNQ